MKHAMGLTDEAGRKSRFEPADTSGPSRQSSTMSEIPNYTYVHLFCFHCGAGNSPHL